MTKVKILREINTTKKVVDKMGQNLKVAIDVVYIQLSLARKLSVKVIAHFTSHVITRCRPGHSWQHLTGEINK